SNNTATGANALFSLTTSTSGGNNTATGVNALYSNTTIAGVSGFNNTATGANALHDNTNGSQNTATGANALHDNTTGYGNTATGDDNIDNGNAGVAGESNTIRIGTVGTHANTFIAGISGVSVAGGVGVIINSSGHLGTVVSSERFKDEIKPMDKASEAILALKPVTFRYKHDL